MYYLIPLLLVFCNVFLVPISEPTNLLASPFFTAFKTVVLSGSSPNFYWDFDSGIHSGKAQKEEGACIKKEKCFSWHRFWFILFFLRSQCIILPDPDNVGLIPVVRQEYSALPGR